jgi:hypothetical protein
MTQYARPDQVLCINRKTAEQPVKPNQSAFIDRFVQGCNGVVSTLQDAMVAPMTHPWCIRGMKFAPGVQIAWEQKRTLYYIDNGYFGNPTSKQWFRIIKNHVHDIRDIIPRDRTRLDRCQITLKNFTPGRKILVAPPSTKSFSVWNMDQEQWINETVAEIKRHTDRPIEIRPKRPRTDRLKTDTIEEALANDVHCLVTFNSEAAVEAIMQGKPAIVLGPNAAGVLSSKSLSEIETPRSPPLDEREAWLCHLSYSQFTFTEIADGTAYHIVTNSP